MRNIANDAVQNVGKIPRYFENRIFSSPLRYRSYQEGCSPLKKGRGSHQIRCHYKILSEINHLSPPSKGWSLSPIFNRFPQPQHGGIDRNVACCAERGFVLASGKQQSRQDRGQQGMFHSSNPFVEVNRDCTVRRVRFILRFF